MSIYQYATNLKMYDTDYGTSLVPLALTTKDHPPAGNSSKTLEKSPSLSVDS